MTRAVLAFALLLAACEPAGPQIHVDLRTDLVPRIEFDTVRTRIESSAGVELADVDHTALRSDDASYESGVRVAGAAAAPGATRVRVDLVANDAVAATRTVLVELRETTVVTVVITRTCVGATCPGPGDDPSATECAGRTCVPPTCTDGGEGCASECEADADCPETAACARPLCVAGVCFAGSDGTGCAAGTFCHPTTGCLPDPIDGADAGVPSDAPLPATDAADPCAGVVCDDSEPCTDDACVAGECTHTANAAPCDDGVFCNGPDTCGAGSCSSHDGDPCTSPAVCSEPSSTCVGCTNDEHCPDPVVGPFDACSGFSGTCDETGTHTRTITTYTCVSGTCTAVDAPETAACSRSTTGVSCGAAMVGPFGSCGGFASTCDESGTRSRSVTSYACAAGTCAPTVGTEDEPCARDTDGTTCMSPTYGAFGACGGFVGMCDESGTQSRPMTTYACAAGSCAGTAGTDVQACSRDTDGMTCAAAAHPCEVYACSTGSCEYVGDSCGAFEHCCEFGCRPDSMLCD